MKKALVLHEDDTVGTAIEDLVGGDRVRVSGPAESEIEVSDDVPFGFKFATRAMAAGEPLR